MFIVGNDYSPALVRGVRMFGKNLFYAIDYWFGGEMKTIDVFEDELAAVAPSKQIGVGL